MQDKGVYKHVTDKRRNPTSKTESDLQDLLLKLKTSGNLTEEEYQRLRPFDSYPATFYTLPKVHKVPLTEELDYFTINTDNTNIPMRPINSCIGSPCYEISKHLASLLKLLYNKDHTVKNSKEFVDFVTTQRVEKDEQIVSFDVTSLFTSIPVDLALEIVKFELESTDAWSEHTKLTAKQIYDLVKFVLKNSFFVFEGKYYHQISGCAMGSPVSAVIAELVMQRVEKIALETSPVPVRWWKRYVDDSNACLKQADIQAFHNHINTINKNIQFTIEIPEVRNGEQSIAFLDTEVITDSAGLVKVKVFRKNAHTDKQIVYKFKCKSCAFTYICQTKRCWCSRWLEHKPGVRRKITSAIKDHAESTGHDVAKTDVKILEKGVMDQQKRLFLEAWHSLSDKESVNVHVEFPSCYLPLLKTIDIENGQYKGNSD